MRMVLPLVVLLGVAGCGGGEEVSDMTSAPPTSGAPRETSSYLGDYTLSDAEFGTEVTVTVADGVRTMASNALPNHPTGEFPNAGNPNAITAQDAVWTFPAQPTTLGASRDAVTPGVSINGVKFEPATAENVRCGSGETYRVEALQSTYDLGFDTNNAHVQPTGEYHYHGVSSLMVEAFNGTEADVVHVGFAADGHLVVYSKSGAYPPSYRLSSEPRTGTQCVPSLRGAATVDLEGTSPDGTFTSDWVFDEAVGVLDDCNGLTIDGEYVYVITETYPFVSRCLKGEFVATRPAGPPAR
jgi:hypothetical protein